MAGVMAMWDYAAMPSRFDGSSHDGTSLKEDVQKLT